MVRAKVEKERAAAILKHGELQGGMARWEHHLAEECEEAIAEMRALQALHKRMPEYEGWELPHTALLTELAQIAQLAQEMMLLIIINRPFKGEESWNERKR